MGFCVVCDICEEGVVGVGDDEFDVVVVFCVQLVCCVVVYEFEFGDYGLYLGDGCGCDFVWLVYDV